MTLEEAAWREEVLGHHDGAIALHERLLGNPAIPDRVRVEAMHRLGICHSMKGHLAPAVDLFLRVLREFPDAEPFAQKAGHNLLLLSPENHPSDRGWFRDERLFLGDLAWVIDGALDPIEASLVSEVAAEALDALRGLRHQLSGDERRAMERSIPALETLQARASDRPADPSDPGGLTSRDGWARSAIRSWMIDRTGLFAPDDANAQVVACRDRLARALAARDAPEIRREAGRAGRWADPVIRWGRQSPAGDYLRLVKDSAAQVAARASEGRFDEARGVWLRSVRALHRGFGAFTLHVPGLGEFPEDLRPELVAVLARVGESLRAIESPDEDDDPLPGLDEAIGQVRRIESRLSETPEADSPGPGSPGMKPSASRRLRRWLEDWNAVVDTLRAGDPARARQLLKPYEL